MTRLQRAGYLAVLLSSMTTSAWSDPIAPPGGFPSGLQVTDVVVGSGPVVGRGDIVAVHYAGFLYDAKAPDHHGRPFDSTADHGGEAIIFRLGKGTVIPGWDAGICGMQRGGRRQLVIPPGLAYGSRGAGRKVPGNTTLVFEVNLISLQVMD